MLFCVLKKICHFYSFSVKERCRQHRTNHVQRIARLVSAVDGVLSSASVPRPDHPSVHQWARGAPRCAQYTGTYIVNFKICLRFASKIINYSLKTKYVFLRIILESNSFKYVGHAESSFSTLFLAILIFHVVQVDSTTWCRWSRPSYRSHERPRWHHVAPAPMRAVHRNVHC